MSADVAAARAQREMQRVTAQSGLVSAWTMLSLRRNVATLLYVGS